MYNFLGWCVLLMVVPQCLGREIVPTRVFTEAGGLPGVIASTYYPHDGYDSTLLRWKLETNPGSVIQLQCSDVRLFLPSKTPDTCEGNYLSIKEAGQEEVKVCGLLDNYTYTSKSNSLDVQMVTGVGGMKAFRCNVLAKIVGPDGGIIEIPMKPFAFSQESQEVDSAEHGLAEGEKKTNCPCGWTNKEAARIVGGEETGVNEYPFAVALVDAVRLYQFCGGAILTQYHVVTAAHCTYRYLELGEKISVIVGDHDITRPDDTDASRLIEVKTIVQHSGFQFETYKYDIALLVLTKKIEFNKFIGPVCLSQIQLNLEKQYVKVLGWGKTAQDGTSSRVLQKVDLRVTPLEVCAMNHLYLIPSDRKHMCTLSKGKDACKGDSGGPVIWLDHETNRYTLVGLVSFGTVCAGEDPSVHTDVTSYLPWIKYYIQATMPEEICSKVG